MSTIATHFHKFIKHMRRRPGYISSASFFTGTMLLSFWYGPHFQDPCVRYTLAGTVTMMFTESMTHAIDTVNTRSKLAKNNDFKSYRMIMNEGISSLTKGIQPVLYGYFFASIAYFYTYSNLKIWLKSNYFEDDFKGKVVPVFVSAMVGEAVSLLFYYPFDLIKTRMQASYVQNYYSTIDAILKTLSIPSKSSSNIGSLFEKIARFYQGGFYFGI